MDILDKLIQEWSWRTKKGYPDFNNEEDLAILREIMGHKLYEAYTEFPKDIAEIPDSKIQDLFNIIKKYPDLKIEDPLALDPNKPRAPKITRSLQRDNKFLEYLSAQLGVEIEPLKPIKWSGLTISFGEGSRGGRGAASKGFSFEKEVEADLTAYSEGRAEFNYPDLTKAIVEEFGLKPGNFKVIPEGAENKPRPLQFTESGPIIGYSEETIAATLTDVTLEKEGKKIYLSLKYGNTLTFFNSGVKKIFADSDFEDGKIDNSNGRALLDTFGIDNEIFCRVFNEYGKTDFKQYHTTSNDFDQEKLFNLVHSGIGSGYYMLKGTKGGYSFYEITEEYAKKAATPISGIEVQYGGTDGKGKRVDIKFESESYYFKVNIRNKQGGLYPSHIMCDYKKK